MHILIRALCLTIPFFLLAFAERFGFVATDDAKTMFAILPALTVLSIIGRGNCRRTRQA